MGVVDKRKAIFLHFDEISSLGTYDMANIICPSDAEDFFHEYTEFH